MGCSGSTTWNGSPRGKIEQYILNDSSTNRGPFHVFGAVKVNMLGCLFFQGALFILFVARVPAQIRSPKKSGEMGLFAACRHRTLESMGAARSPLSGLTGVLKPNPAFHLLNPLILTGSSTILTFARLLPRTWMRGRNFEHVD